MKNCKLLAVANALAGTIVLFSTQAHAQPFCNTFGSNFNDAPGSCAGNCSLDGWFTAANTGIAGFNTVFGNGFLWISHDGSWNAWNVEVNPASQGNGSGSSVGISASIFSTDSGGSQIGELDIWEDLGGGNLNPISLGNPIFGTNGAWTNVNFGTFDTSRATSDGGKNVLIVFGRQQGEGSQERIAVDNFSVELCDWIQ